MSNLPVFPHMLKHLLMLIQAYEYLFSTQLKLMLPGVFCHMSYFSLKCWNSTNDPYILKLSILLSLEFFFCVTEKYELLFLYFLSNF